jgi:hypothetical protein
MIPVIAVGFALLAGLLLWFVIGSRGPWWVKLSAIVATCAFTFAVWDALDSFSGWPTAQSPPAHALLVASSVDEPRAIYLWLVDSDDRGLLEYRAHGAQPRSYRLPYSRDLHEQVERAAALVRKGKTVEIRRSSTNRSSRGAHLVIREYQLPAASLPRKESATTAGMVGP